MGLWKIHLDCQGYSLKGKARAINEDHYQSLDLVLPLGTLASRAVFLAVADGLGGEAAGERASRIATDSMAGYLTNPLDKWTLVGPEGMLKSSLIRAHLDILSDGNRHPENAGMATTLTAALVLWPVAYVVHAGDSRCYRLRNGRLTRLTTDHTVEQQLLDRGQLSPGAANSSRYKHILWNHLGGGDHFPVPDVSPIELETGDALLLTTDGLTDMLPDQDLEELASRVGSAESISRLLIHAARARGARDDATALFARFGTPSVPVDVLRRRGADA